MTNKLESWGASPYEEHEHIKDFQNKLKELHLNLDAKRVNELMEFSGKALEKLLIPIRGIIELHILAMEKIGRASKEEYKGVLYNSKK